MRKWNQLPICTAFAPRARVLRCWNPMNLLEQSCRVSCSPAAPKIGRGIRGWTVMLTVSVVLAAAADAQHEHLFLRQDE